MTHAQILDEPPVTVPRRLLRTILVVGIAFAGIVGVGCTPYPTEPFPPNPDPLTDVQYWNAGDSVAWMWPQYSTHTIHNAARRQWLSGHERRDDRDLYAGPAR